MCLPFSARLHIAARWRGHASLAPAARSHPVVPFAPYTALSLFSYSLCSAPLTPPLRSTALVLEIGGGFTSAAAVVDGAMQPHTLQQSKVTGAVVSRCARAMRMGARSLSVTGAGGERGREALVGAALRHPAETAEQVSGRTSDCPPVPSAATAPALGPVPTVACGLT